MPGRVHPSRERGARGRDHICPTWLSAMENGGMLGTQDPTDHGQPPKPDLLITRLV